MTSTKICSFQTGTTRFRLLPTADNFLVYLDFVVLMQWKYSNKHVSDSVIRILQHGVVVPFHEIIRICRVQQIDAHNVSFNDTNLYIISNRAV